MVTCGRRECLGMGDVATWIATGCHPQSSSDPVALLASAFPRLPALAPGRSRLPGGLVPVALAEDGLHARASPLRDPTLV